MSDDQTQTDETGGDAAVVETEAREKGWVPKEEFRGDPTKWTDAPQFLELNKNVRQDRDRLRGDINGLRSQNANLEARLRAQQAALDALQTDVTETKTANLDEQEADLTAQIKEARKSNDFDAEETLRDKREEIRREKAGLTVDKTRQNDQTRSNGKDLTQTPEFQAFLGENPWFESDKVMAAAAVAILSDLNASGKTKDLTPSQRFALVAEETKKRFGIQDRRGTSKTEGSRGGADAGGGDGTGKSYSDLPADAKAACDKMVARVVGPGKKFKDESAWRKSYAATYFK